MKYFLVFLMFCYNSYALSDDCLTISDVNKIKKIFQENKKDMLIEMSSNDIRHYVINDDLLTNKNSTLINVSDAYYGWGIKKDSGYPLHSSKSFPGAKVCVWNVALLLPEKMRTQCDDDGAYGYFIDFKKINDEVFMYRFTSLFDVLPDGTLACKAANEFMMQK